MTRAHVLQSLLVLTTCALAANAKGGTFLDFSANDPDVITFAGGTDLGNGIRLVQVCLDPAQLPAGNVNPTLSDPEQAIRNAVAEFNRMHGTLGNVVDASDSGVTDGRSDFESVALHEIGHCVGLDHSVLGASEAGSGSVDRYYMNSFPGSNGVFDTNDGTDNVRASWDDQRGDDINRSWFRLGVNNPFAALPVIIDQSTFSNDLVDLPTGHDFPEATTHFLPCSSGGSTSNLRGQPHTTNAMYPTLCTNNVIRQLARDDVATLRIGEAGANGLAGDADDYKLQLNYKGKTTSGCDITIEFNSSAGYAFCSVSASPSGGNYTIFEGTASFNSGVDWYFNQTDTTSNDLIFADGFD